MAALSLVTQYLVGTAQTTEAKVHQSAITNYMAKTSVITAVNQTSVSKTGTLRGAFFYEPLNSRTAMYYMPSYMAEIAIPAHLNLIQPNIDGVAMPTDGIYIFYAADNWLENP